MSRLFLLTLPRRLRVLETRGGGRWHVTLRADEPADALRLYRQEYPDGPEPVGVEEFTHTTPQPED